MKKLVLLIIAAVLPMLAAAQSVQEKYIAQYGPGKTASPAARIRKKRIRKQLSRILSVFRRAEEAHRMYLPLLWRRKRTEITVFK